mgnify:CR=1 FL=1
MVPPFPIAADKEKPAGNPGRHELSVGEIDYPSVFAAIQATGYDGWVTVELYPYVEDPDAAGKEAMEYLQDILEQVGGEAN